MSKSLNRPQDGEAGNRAVHITGSAMPLMVDSTNSRLIMAFLASYFFLINVLSIPSRLLMRKNMGERVFSVFAFVLSTIALLAILFAAFWYGFGAFPLMTDYQFATLEGVIPKGIINTLFILLNPYSIFFILFLQKGATHFKQALNRAQNDEYLYSFSEGESLYFNHKKGKTFLGFEVDDKILAMIYEPWGILRLSIPMIVVCGFISNNTDLVAENSFLYCIVDNAISGIRAVSIAFSISAISLFIEEFGDLLKERGAVLDMLDGEIDMQRIIAKKERLIIRQTQGAEEMIKESSLLN